MLIDSDYHAKISDFGLAKLFISKSKNSFTFASTVRGSSGYIADEFHVGELSPKCDVFSYGVVMKQML